MQLGAMAGVRPPSCALLGGFAIGVRLSFKVTIIWEPQSRTTAEGASCKVLAPHSRAVGGPTWASGGASCDFFRTLYTKNSQKAGKY